MEDSLDSSSHKGNSLADEIKSSRHRAGVRRFKDEVQQGGRKGRKV